VTRAAGIENEGVLSMNGLPLGDGGSSHRVGRSVLGRRRDLRPQDPLRSRETLLTPMTEPSGTGGGVYADRDATVSGAVEGGNVNNNVCGTASPVEDNVDHAAC